MQERIVLWTLRGAVALLPFTIGSALSDWLQTHVTHDIPVFLFAWITWAALLLSTLVPHPMAKTTARIISVALVGIAFLLPQARNHPVYVLHALLILVLAESPYANMWWINGTAYPNERRYSLRLPSMLAIGPLLITYAVVIAVPVAAVLLYANAEWAPAIICTLLSIPVLFFGVQAIHQLGKRWVVFVPAGVVLHDPMSLVDPVLFERAVIEKFAPATADTDALDLTQSALGMPIELDLTEKVPMVLSRAFGNAESGSSARLMFTPSRPGEVLAEANRRKIPN